MGITTGTIVGQEVKKWKGSDIDLLILQVELLGDSPEEVEWWDIAGEKTRPINGDRIVVKNLGGGYKVGILTKDLIQVFPDEGERKFYARTEEGNIIASMYLKNDGTVEIDSLDLDEKVVANIHLKNDSSIDIDTQDTDGNNIVSIALKPDGDVQADITKDLILNVDGDLTATVLGATTLESTGDVDITAPNVNIFGNVNIEGDVDIIGNQTNDGTLDVTGNIASEADVSADGDTISDAAATAISGKSHDHIGNLGFNTGPPNPGGGVAPPGSPPSVSGNDIQDGNGTKSTLHTHPITSGSSSPGPTGTAT